MHTRSDASIRHAPGWRACMAMAALWVLSASVTAAGNPDYIPEPQPVKTSILVGAHHCPLWEADKLDHWTQIVKHPERTPALGFYAQENPEISDWETKWAVEHGISFFVYCWYRSSQGGPVTMRYGTAIHDALFKSRFRDKMKFTIMWENQSRGTSGVADERDLTENLLPFWIEKYFKHPSYLKIDNRPLLFIYRPEFLAADLGGEAQAHRAVERMREACRAAGFDGLYVLGEYRGVSPAPIERMKRLGLDYTFAYCWHVPNNPSPAQAIDAQMDFLRKTQALGILPQVVTLSQGWSGWRDEGSIWKLPPDDYEKLLRKGKAFAASLPPDQLGSRVLLLDNWNEWGEGHYIAPHREFGFGYLDAARRVFAPGAPPHKDIVPEDIGRGPYDTAYREGMRAKEALRREAVQVVSKPGAPRDGLLAWWAFDEAPGTRVALDYSGNGRGGRIENAERAPGRDGSALVCAGGAVVVEDGGALVPTGAFTLSCWVKTDLPGQKHHWFLNSIFGNGATGCRLGVTNGRPCFQLPQTPWSHYLAGKNPLPAGRWVHVAATFDGAAMRLYMDGKLEGTLPRPGPARPGSGVLCLGNFAAAHAAHFTGLLDEVQLLGRALSDAEISALAAPK